MNILSRFRAVKLISSFKSINIPRCFLLPQLEHPRLNIAHVLQKFSTITSENIELASPTETHVSLDLKTLELEYQKEIDEINKAYEDRKERRQSIVGIVTSTKASKSITVTYQHPKVFKKYNAVLNVRRKVMAHDEEEICQDGDLVRVVPCRPMSRKKRHKIIDVIRKARKLDSDTKIYSYADSYPASKGGKRGLKKEARKKAKTLKNR